MPIAAYLSELSPEDRCRELAIIFAKGIIRLRKFRLFCTDNSQNSSPECLDVSNETVLSVNRVNGFESSRDKEHEMLNIAKEVAAMEWMTVDQLRARYAEVFGERTNGRHKEWLIKRIIWRIQANAEGDLSERARRRAEELANDADLRMTPPRQPKPAVDAGGRTVAVPAAVKPSTNLLPGTVLRRQYKGRTVRAEYRETGIPDYDGNPLIEALPPVLTDDQATVCLARYPQYDESHRRSHSLCRV